MNIMQFENSLVCNFHKQDIFKLILYQATLLKVFIGCKNSAVEFLGSFIYILSYNQEIKIL